MTEPVARLIKFLVIRGCWRRRAGSGPGLTSFLRVDAYSATDEIACKKIATSLIFTEGDKTRLESAYR